MARESWLRSNDHEKFAKAAMACEGYTPACIASEFCHQEGMCFRSLGKADRMASKIIAAASYNAPADIAAALNDAAVWLLSRDAGQSAPAKEGE